MPRHRFDPLSFIFGLLFVAVAGVALVGGDLIVINDLAWIAPAVLVVAGAVLLLSTAGRDSSEDVPDDAPEDAPEDAPGDERSRAQTGASDAPDLGSEADGR